MSITWRSRVVGRARTIGNRVYPIRVSRVRIPSSPPKQRHPKRGAFCFARLEKRDSNHVRKPRRGLHEPVQTLANSFICATSRGANACESLLLRQKKTTPSGVVFVLAEQRKRRHGYAAPKRLTANHTPQPTSGRRAASGGQCLPPRRSRCEHSRPRRNRRSARAAAHTAWRAR